MAINKLQTSKYEELVIEKLREVIAYFSLKKESHFVKFDELY